MYNRQRTLQLNIPQRAHVIGCGGVGSWTALFLALAGVPEIHLWDSDYVDRTNLNRTPFHLDDVGMEKTYALSKVLYEHREAVQVYVHPNWNGQPLDGEVFDCRDVLTPPIPNVKMMGGYNGKGFTLHTNPRAEVIDSSDDRPRRGYTITPSYIVPPVLIATLLVARALEGMDFNEEKILTTDVPAFLKGIFYAKEKD